MIKFCHCGHLINPYSSRCQNVHCNGVQPEPAPFEPTPAPIMPTTCSVCGCEVEPGGWNNSQAQPMCQSCFFAPVALGIARAVAA